MKETLSLGGGSIHGNIETTKEQAELEITPLVYDYATRPTEESFDWPEILRQVSDRHELSYGHQMYLVVFRSQRRPDADIDELLRLDDEARIEASVSPGYLHYFRGQADPDGNCVSFCLWESLEDARLASSLPAHQEAVTRAREFYIDFYPELRHVWLDDSPAGFAMTESMHPHVHRG